MKKLLVAMFVALLMVGCGEDFEVPQMIACDGCKKEVSSSADDCPNCGHPVEDSVDVYVEEWEEIIKRADEIIRLTEEETAEAKPAQVGGKEREEIIKRADEIIRLTVDLDDDETLDGIIAEAIDFNKLQWRGKKGEELHYAPNQQTPHKGWAKKMYGNGQIQILYQYKDGKLDGLRAVWFENGQRSEEGNLKDRKEYGPWTNYYKNGQIKRLAQFKDGKLDGLWRSWWENGKKEAERNYKDGKVMTIVVWKPSGEKCPVTNINNGNGILVDYYEDGTEKNRLTFKDGEIVRD
jgi:hypothetical protein